VLSVGLVVSAIPALQYSAPAPAQASVTPPAVLTEKAATTVHSTDTDTLVLAFHSKPADPAAAARKAAGAPAWSLAGAKVVSAKTLRPDAASVTFDKSLSRTQANRLAAAVSKASGVRYADASATFYPTDAGGSDYYWNIDAINASAAWATTKGSSDVVVGVIDTGIADNSLLPKALLINTVSGTQITGPTVSGTTWPGLTVTVTYVVGSTTSNPTTQADSRGNWSLTLPGTATNGSPLAISVVDSSGNTTKATATLDNFSSVSVISPTNGTDLVGTAEVGSAVSIKYNGTDDAEHTSTVTATSPDGNWTTTLSPAAKDGSTLSVTATDLAGNGSSAVTAIVDSSIELSVNPSNGKSVSGTTEPGATIAVTFNDTEICRTTADNSTGGFSCDTSSTSFSDKDQVRVTATDAVRNTTAKMIEMDTSAPSVSVDPSNGTTVAGTAEADSAVKISYTDADGVEHTSAVTATGGTWTASLDPAAKDGSTLSVTATDAAGNTSDAKTVTVDSSVKLELKPSNGKTISGTTDPSATLTFASPGGDALCADQTADSEGHFTCAPDDRLADGTQVVVTTTDPLGNTTHETITVDASTHLSVNPSNGTTISGTADADATITLTYPDARTQEATVDGTTWTLTPNQNLADNDEVTITATDTLNNTDTKTIKIDAAAPGLSLDPSNGKLVQGTTDADATVTVKVVDGAALCSGLAPDSEGAFTCTPDDRLADGTQVVVTTTDPLGNTTHETITVDASTHLSVNPSNGTTISGTADADATITLTYPDARTQEATVDGTTWTLTPNQNLADNDEVTITATDTLNNTDTKTIKIDAAAPNAPQISTATPDKVSGTAEAAATIVLSYLAADDSTVTLTTTASDGGAWSFTDLQTPPVVGRTVSVSAKDAAGNTSAAATEVVSDPSTASPSPSPSGSESGSSESVNPNEARSASAGIRPAGSAVPLTSTTVGSGTVLPGYDFVFDAKSPTTNADGTVSNQDGDGDGRDADATDKGVNIYADQSTQPRSSHGTHVAGIIAANGSSTLSGVAPGVKIQPIRALSNRDGGSMADIASAIRWAVGESVTGSDGTLVTNPYADDMDVLNLSVGASQACSDEMQGAIDAAWKHGTTVVVSAGNDNTSIATTSPANCQHVIVVTASSSDRTRAGYSNWGTSATSSSWLVAAPGGSGGSSVCTAWYNSLNSANQCTDQVVSTVNGRWMPKYGTSMAAPHVAATAALLKSIDKSLTPADIARYIRGTTTAMSDGCPTGTCGSGIVNAANAVKAVASRVSPNEGPATTVTPPANIYATTWVTVAWPKTVRVGSTFTANAGNYAISYQWYRDGKVIPGATRSTYTATASDYEKKLSVKATGFNSATRTTGTNSRAITGILKATVRPTITGTLGVGHKLTATKGTWSASVKVKYQWLRNGKSIHSATHSTYKLTSKDRGKQISVRVTASASRYYTTTSTSVRSTKIGR